MESREKEEMTIEEAEKFYKTYAGNKFYMYRDETDMYINFDSLNLAKTILNKWDREIINELFANLWNTKEDVFYSFMQLFDVIKRDELNLETNMILFLDEIEKCTKLDYKQRIIILENFGGETPLLKDGYCYYICKNTSLQNKMNVIVTRLMDFTCENDEEEEKNRIMAVEVYKKAYKKFSKKT